jgi:hypothetical protein
VAPVVVPAPRPATTPAPAVDDVDQKHELILEDLTREQVLDWRARARAAPAAAKVARMCTDTSCGQVGIFVAGGSTWKPVRTVRVLPPCAALAS